MRLADLNALDAAAAAAAFLRCCGSTRWSARMASVRPFVGIDAMSAAADATWWALDQSDWLEAFAAHPKIGEGQAGRGGGTGQAGPVEECRWSDDEQRGVADAADATLRRLADANRDYEARFGYIFIVCATGLTADEMLALLERRLRHDPGDEIQVAAEEQRRITQLRLRKLLNEEPDHIS